MGENHPKSREMALNPPPLFGQCLQIPKRHLIISFLEFDVPVPEIPGIGIS